MRYFNKELKRELVEFGVIVGLLLAMLGAFHAFGSDWKGPYVLPYGCEWQICRVKDGKLFDCQEKQHGSTSEFVEAIKRTEDGSVRYDCGPGKGER